MRARSAWEMRMVSKGTNWSEATVQGNEGTVAMTWDDSAEAKQG